MDKDTVLRLARNVGAAQPESLYGRTDYVVMTEHDLTRFAALILAERKPLSDAEVSCLCRKHLWIHSTAFEEAYFNGFRDAEAAHGIGEKQ